MADQAARDKEEAMRERIVAHMNADHQDSVRPGSPGPLSLLEFDTER